MNDEGDEERERSEREERRGGVCMDVDVCVKDDGDVFLATGTKQRKQERNECCPSTDVVKFIYAFGIPVVCGMPCGIPFIAFYASRP